MSEKTFVTFMVSVVLVAAGVAAIVKAVMSYQHGIYASMHYSEAQDAVNHVLADTYGLGVLAGMRFASPNVVNTHLDRIRQQPTRANSAAIATSTEQVRVFHLIGRRGVRWCVGVWDINAGTSYYYGKYFVTKACVFAENE